jgi:hypothetical protein
VLPLVRLRWLLNAPATDRFLLKSACEPFLYILASPCLDARDQPGLRLGHRVEVDSHLVRGILQRVCSQGWRSGYDAFELGLVAPSDGIELRVVWLGQEANEEESSRTGKGHP